MKELSTVTNELEQIDLLIIKGWSPCINKQPCNKWHVGLRHDNCPELHYMATNDGEDEDTIISCKTHELSIHVTLSSLKDALLAAIMKANEIKPI